MSALLPRLTARDLAAMEDDRRDGFTCLVRDMHDSDRMDLDDTPVPPPPVRCLPPRRNLVRHVWRSLKLYSLRLHLKVTEDEIKVFEGEGIYGTRYLRACRDQAAELRVRIAITEAS